MKTKTILFQVVLIVTFFVCNQSVRAQIFKANSLSEQSADAQSQSNSDVSISLNSNDASITFNAIAWSQANAYDNTSIPQNNQKYTTISQATSGCRCKKRGWGCGINEGCQYHCRMVCGPLLAENLSTPDSETSLNDIYPAIIPIK